MIDQTLIELFKFLGFDEKQAEIYNCLLQYPRIGLRDIARITKIPRTSLYDYYPKLLAKGLIIESSDQGRRIFSANDPKLFLDKINQLKEKISKSEKEYESLLSKYQQVYQSSDLFPKISYYSGESGLKIIFKLILKYRENRATYLGNKDNDVEWFDVDLNRWFLDEIERKGIKSKKILYNDKLTKWYLRNYGDKFNLAKVYRGDIYNDQGDVDKYIFGDHIALIDYGRQIVVIIKDKAFANNEAVQFDIMWEKL